MASTLAPEVLALAFASATFDPVHPHVDVIRRHVVFNQLSTSHRSFTGASSLLGTLQSLSMYHFQDIAKRVRPPSLLITDLSVFLLLIPSLWLNSLLLS